MRRGAALLAVALSACGAEKAPHVVHQSYAAACQADTATLKTQAETTHAMTNAYSDASSSLHKVTAAGASFTITIVDARCGVVGHTVGQTPTDY